jgi:hypothetical protein
MDLAPKSRPCGRRRLAHVRACDSTLELSPPTSVESPSQ